jgi:dipeptidase D
VLISFYNDQTIRRIMELFEQLSEIPRCSGNEAEIAHWLLLWAQERGIAAKVDPSFNVIMSIPATSGYEQEPGIVLQAHLDMVCIKTATSCHNFDSDSIKIVQEGDWLKAYNTSLGADNGIGIAIALAIAENISIAHPDLDVISVGATIENMHSVHERLYIPLVKKLYLLVVGILSIQDY